LSHRYCYLPLSWKSWNWFECAVGGVRHPQHTQTGGSSAVGRGRSDRTDHDQQHCYHYVPTVNQRLLLQLIGSWWWARGCPKHVELYLNDKQ
jgi:hypothetical protein